MLAEFMRRHDFHSGCLGLGRRRKYMWEKLSRTYTFQEVNVQRSLCLMVELESFVTTRMRKTITLTECVRTFFEDVGCKSDEYLGTP